MTTPSPLDLLDARYGADAPAIAADAPWNAVLDSLLGHASVRAFLPDALPAGALEAGIAAAQSAATSSNLQVWSVVAVEAPETKAKLADWTGGQKHVSDCPTFLVWLADLARLRRCAERAGSPSEGLDHLEMLLVGVIDAALAAQNAVAAFESMGLGSVYIGGIRNQLDKVAAELKLPPLVTPVFGLCVGTPARAGAVKPRLPQAAVLHREHYDLDAQDAVIDAYDATMQGFYTSQGMKAHKWTPHSVKRIADAAALTGRDLLRQKLEALGFLMR
ncbi:nitroreductase family protein [Derxia gummosa]|uniref:Nitroreductase family protein n=1 Tax=Derxia gummosa DSM 723 TaxID=1121388 RepID=A0A8B6X693_9BURK|nr:nitroreductase family protein [Derxia gummosa]